MPSARRDTILWSVTTAALSLPFLLYAANNLENFRPVSGDDAWIMSASYKLATRGVLGSDLYAGLFNGEHRYYFNLPAHHYFQAAAFRLFDVGVAQARWPSLAAAALIIWTASWLAFRWYGLLAAWLTTILLIAWRSDLVALYPGLPLLGVARSGRYDVAAVALVWASIVFVDRLVRQSGRVTAFLVGLCGGLAMLTQFFGAFVLPVVAIAWIRHRRTLTTPRASCAWIALGVATVAVPYAIHVALHPADWIGQNFTIRSDNRMQLDSASFYIANLLGEPRRFAHLAFDIFGPAAFDRPLGPYLLAVGVWPALVHLAVRVGRRGSPGDEILLSSIVMFLGGLALVDSTKAPLYAVVLLPSVCLVIGSFVARIARWGGSTDRHRLVRVATISLIVMLLGIVLLDGLRAYRIDLRESRQASQYLDVGGKIRSHLQSEVGILGPNRWWWALHDQQYLSLNNIWWQWKLASDDSASEPRFADWVTRTRTTYIIVTNDVRSDLRRFPQPLQRQFWDFLATFCRRKAEWDDPTYGTIEVYAVIAPDG